MNIKKSYVIKDVVLVIGDQDVVDMLVNNMKALRRTRVYKDALVVVYIEVGSSNIVADRVSKLMDVIEFQPIMIEKCMVRGEWKPGVITTDEQKRLGTMHLTRELSLNSLHVAMDLITQDTKKAITELANEMRSWRKDVVVPRDQAIGKFREVFTGKAAMGGKKDDRVVCLILVLYWSARNHKDPDFDTEMRRRGIL
jgi:hypothetical protein